MSTSMLRSHGPVSSGAPLAPRLGPDSVRDSTIGGTRLSALNPSLISDLERFLPDATPGAGVDLVAVLAAAIRHSRSLRLVLQLGPEQDPVMLNVYAAARLVHCAHSMVGVLAGRLAEWRLLSIEPAKLPTPEVTDRLSDPHLYAPLAELLWAVAMRGGRDDLLPEIAGIAAYRVAPAAELHHLGLHGTLGNAVQRLRRQTTNLREISKWPGFDRVRAQRLLNALYLQAALLISHSHPAATNEGWVGPLT